MEGILNFKSRKGRKINADKPIKVYRNLHNGKLSLKQGTLVVGYCDEINLKNVTMKVSERGREKVIETQQKNVHAYIVGKLCGSTEIKGTEVTYNPYKYKTFVTTQKKEPLYNAEYITINSNGRMYI